MYEHKAAFELSRLETNLNPDRRRIENDLAAGLFVVVQDGTVFCKFTDAAIGCKRIYLGSFIHREDAVEFAAEYDDEEHGTIILPATY